MQELVSVIIPVYKVENYIDKCMESVLTQSYENLEILLVDDGSPDNCGRICEDYAAKDSRIRVIHKMNGGLSSARNAALDVMTGEWVVCIDSDDYVHRDYIKKLYEAVVRNDADIAICSHYREKGDTLSITEKISDEEKSYSNLEALKKLIDDDDIKNYAWGKIYRAELFDGVRYPDGRNYEDIATTYYLFDKAKKIVKIPEYLYYYIIRDDSISFNRSPRMWHKGCHASCLGQQERCDYFRKKGYDELFIMAQAKLLPYLYSDITTGYADDALDDVKAAKDYISAHRQEFVANPLISSKDKKLIGVYLKKQAYYQLYSRSKAKITKTFRIFKRSRRIIKTVIYNTGFDLNGSATKRIVYFELPCFDNLGDHAIAYVSKEMLQSFCNEHKEYQLFVVDGWNIDKAISTLKKKLTPEDVVICQGGGNFGSLYEFAEIYRGKVFKYLKNSRIILMPQTCFYSEDETGRKALEEDKRLIADCKDITLFARDEKSLDFMRDNFDADVEFLHDTVSLFDAQPFSSEKRDGIVICLRSDKEGTLKVENKKEIIQRAEERGRTHITDTCTNYEVKLSERQKVLEDKWKLWGSSKLVITDRLHGMIFSIITKTPCIVIGNNHFKVYEAYKTFAENEYIRFIDSMDMLETAMDELLSLDLSGCCKKDYREDIELLWGKILKRR